MIKGRIGFHPRHFEVLSDAALGVLSAVSQIRSHVSYSHKMETLSVLAGFEHVPLHMVLPSKVGGRPTGPWGP